ncbi:MAG: hypothetical protein V5A61_15320 [Haloarculaceae archaeon]
MAPNTTDTTGDAGGLDPLFRFLVAYRLVLYLGGLIAISLPLGLAWLFDVELSAAARTAVVGVSFAVILLTYLAERRVGLDHTDEYGEPTESYSVRMRATFLLSLLGVAVGVYFLARGRVGAGLLFLGGAFLFAGMAYRREGDRTGGAG